jgi:magnesium transporter
VKARLLRKKRITGQMPGTLEAPRGALPSGMEIIAFNPDHFEEIQDAKMDDLQRLRAAYPMIWVNVHGLADVALIAQLGEFFGLHAMALEDVLHVPQRAKTEEYDSALYIVIRMLEHENNLPVLDQLSMFLGKNFVLTIQERAGDAFGPVRERLRKDGRRQKMMQPDYLSYAILDAVIDGYFPLLENYGDKLDQLEEDVLQSPTPSVIRNIHLTKRDLHALRLCIWPMREAISRIRAGSSFVHEEMQIYLRDCHDHIIQVLDILESYRERISALNDLYLSAMSQKLNEVMKVLTMIATIFMPLSFISGIYGMNFNTDHPLNMPELNAPFGYIGVLIFLAALAMTMVVYFWHKGWIGGSAGTHYK